MFTKQINKLQDIIYKYRGRPKVSALLYLFYKLL